jgi:hypothetical protein
MMTSKYKNIAIVIVGLIVFGFLLFKFNLLNGILPVRTVNEENEFYKLTAKYPNEKWDNINAMGGYVDYNLNQKRELWKIGGDAYTTQKKVEKDFPDSPKVKYEMNIDYKESDSKRFGIHNYVFQNYEFTGGAHGNTGLATFSFDKNGRVDINNILDLNNGNDEAITKLLEQKLTETLGENSSTQMIRDGLGLNYFDANGKLDKGKCNCDGFLFSSNLQNFRVEDDGIVFIMGQYQVAPYVAGMPEAKLKWDVLEEFLNPNFNLVR